MFKWWRRKYKGHDKTAYNCRYWTGDRRGCKFEAVCKECAAEGRVIV